MKTLVLLSAVFALCSGSAIPLIPGDNSNYVEGVSRYFWMPDGDGIPQLVDTQEPIDYMALASRNGANNQYWLFTRNNPTSGQLLNNGDLNSVKSSNFAAGDPTVVVVHGWRNNRDSDVNKMITKSVLAKVKANVIVLDWNKLAGNVNYYTSAAGVPDIGNYLGDFLNWLVSNTGVNWNNVHLTGHSLGAHVIGSAGRRTGGRPARVTGLDPAGPAWGSNNDRLNTAAGQYVEAIHTDGNLLGLFAAMGHADFYPNGGTNAQPGCWISTCSHSRAYELFAATVENNHLVGKKCNDIGGVSNGSCSGSSLNMGNNILTKRGSGIYYLKTGSSWPY